MAEGMTLRRQRRRAPTSEVLSSIHDFVVRRTGTLKENGLRINWANLTDDDQAELVELTREAEQGGGGFKLDNLSRKRARRWEALVARGAGEPESFFEDRRKADEIRALATEATARSVRRPFKPREEVGLIATVARVLRNGHLNADHVAFLLFVACQWETGVPLATNATVQRAGEFATLTIDPSYGLLSGDRDPHSSLARWKETLGWLEDQKWLTVTRAGNRWTLAPGPRLVSALRVVDEVARKKVPR
jgi:hypothetical protein